MPTMPLWLTASTGPFTVVITPQSVDSGGVMTDTTPVATMTASLDDVNFDYNPTTENVSAMTSPRRNPVITERGSTFSCGEILKKSGSNLLAAAAYGQDYFKFEWTRGAQKHTGYVCCTGYRETSQGKGKVVGTGTFETCDIGSANPTYA